MRTFRGLHSYPVNCNGRCERQAPEDVCLTLYNSISIWPLRVKQLARNLTGGYASARVIKPCHLLGVR
jgi:hypothetical protein